MPYLRFIIGRHFINLMIRRMLVFAMPAGKTQSTFAFGSELE